VIDPKNVKSRLVYKHAEVFYSLAADWTRDRMFAGSSDYGIHVYDLSSEVPEPIDTWSQHDNYVTALAWADHPSSPVLISGSYDHKLRWWDVDGKPIRTLPAHDGWLRDLAVFPDNERFVSVGDDMLVKLWEVQSGKLISALSGHAVQTPQGFVSALYAVAISPDGRYLASGDRVGEVRVWEADTGKLLNTFQVPTLYTFDGRQRKRSIGGIRSLAFSNDGKQLAVGGIGQVGNVDGLEGPIHVEIWDWQQPRQIVQLGAEGHKALANQLLFTPDGQYLIAGGGGGGNGILAFWKLPGEEAVVAKSDERPADNSAAKPAESKDGDGQKENANKDENKSADNKKPADKPDPAKAHPLERIKCEGHIHRFLLNPQSTELYAAGHRKLEIWHLG
jgi:WD40 repeat protein